MSGAGRHTIVASGPGRMECLRCGDEWSELDGEHPSTCPGEA